MIHVEQAQKRGICYICGTLIQKNHVITLVLPKDGPPRAAHLYCYALTRQRQQRQAQQRKALQPS